MDALTRQWLILLMIPRRSRIATSDILQRLNSEYTIETTIRTIQRDLHELSRVFPLVNDGKRPAGWSWNKDAPVFDLPSMEPIAALTFCLVRDSMIRLLPRSAHNSLKGYFQAADNRLKTLPNSRLPHWPDKVRVVSRNLRFEAPNMDDSILDALYEALQLEICFEVDYQTREGKNKSYFVNPLGLVFIDALIYLVATLNDHIDPVSLLAHRMKAIKLLPDKQITVPAGYTLDGYIESGEIGYLHGDPIKLKAVFQRDAAKFLFESNLSKNQQLTQTSDGKVILESTVVDSTQLRWWLRGFGAQVEIIEPEFLRDEFMKLSGQIAEMYLQK